jgi:hypothetical protein
MRVYVPCHRRSLADLVTHGRLAGPTSACAVTPALRSWYAEGDEEDLEYAAQSRAADLSLALVTTDDEPRRIVLAVDVTAEVDPAVDDLVGVAIPGEIAVDDVAAVLIDAPSAMAAVRAAAAALIDSTVDVPPEVEALDEHELTWYAPEELNDLVARS